MEVTELIINKSMGGLYNWTNKKISFLGFDEYYTHVYTTAILLIAGVILLYLIDFLLRKVLPSFLKKFLDTTKYKQNNPLIKNNVFGYITHIIPLLIGAYIFPAIFSGFPNIILFVSQLIYIILVITFTLFIHSIIKSVRDFAKSTPRLADKPLDSYLQVVSIFLYFICGIVVFSLLTGRSAWNFLLSLGAASAILMLIFKDTIMGFVASIQVSSYDMIRVGDWIEMPKFEADGTVMEINLNTVKVQNFDKTITTIPTYYLITDSFKNYRGMHTSGGRRIKRYINIKISSIRFLEKNEIDELKRIQILAPYIEERTAEIEGYNIRSKADPTMPVNGRKMTNVGLFRAYILLYAQNNPNIHKEHTLMIRQLQPTEHGLPIELYMFTNETEWVFYETVMADIFDHLLASIKYFKLEVFELPASDDFRNLKGSL